MKQSLALVLAGLLALAAPNLGAATRQDAGHTQLLLDDMRTFTDVFNLVRVNYVDEVGDRDLLDAALRGMVSELDPHSEFLEPGQARAQDDEAQGRFGGIGVEVDVREGRIHIAKVNSAGPAQRGGIVVGDVITAVDGVPVKGRPVRQSLDALRGEPGTRVEVGLEDRSVNLVRAYIPVASVYAELMDGDIGYFQITHFHAHSGEQFRAAMRDTTSAAGDGLAGIILDLRGNGGGVVGSAIVIADGFLDDGLVVYTRGRDARPRVEYFAEPGQWAPEVPVAVLIDRRTASASEILAGALQDHKRATLIGEKTYGKGTVQTVLPLRNGGALKLTTSRYYTPDGRSIDEAGINPDVVASVASGPENDPPLRQAMQLLQNGEQ